MRRWIAAVILSLGWSACRLPGQGPSLTEQFDAVCNSWKGSTVSGLISSWGPPTSSYAMPSGDTLYTWGKVSGEHVSDPALLERAAARGLAVCKTLMTVNPQQIITSASWVGVCT